MNFRFLILSPLILLTACSTGGLDAASARPRLAGVEKVSNASLEYASFEVSRDGGGALVRGIVKPFLSPAFLAPAQGRLDMFVYDPGGNLIEKASTPILSAASSQHPARVRSWTWQFSATLKSSPAEIASIRFVHDRSASD
jgi:hypothetical protein